MQAGRVSTVLSTDGVDFTAALAQNAVAQADLALPSEIAGVNTGAASRIRGVQVWSSDNLAWVIQFYARHNARSADPNVDTFLGQVKFATTDAVQDPIGSLWKYSTDLRDIRYDDLDQLGQLHVVLVNTSAGGKTAYGSGGHFRVAVALEAAQGG